VRTTGDVNGDGRQDIVAFGDHGVWVALSEGAGFSAPSLVLGDMGFVAGGWTSDHPRLLVDTDRDGRDDIVGFGNDGVWIARSQGSDFAPPQLVLSEFGRHSRPAWTTPFMYPRVAADVNGDGYPDLVGYGPNAIYRALGGAGGFQPPAKLLRAFVVKLGTNVPRLVGDVDGDGKADLVAFSPAGIEVASSSEFTPGARVCPPDPPWVVEIREADPNVDRDHHNLMRSDLMVGVTKPNATILLGPNVVLDFSDLDFSYEPSEGLPLRFGPCVTLTSVSGFGSAEERSRPARTARSRGPLLQFGPLGPHRSQDMTFLDVVCSDPDPNNPDPNNPDKPMSDNVRISGFRLYGPSFGQQRAFNKGIFIKRCLNIEVSNMEIAGWGGQGVQVLDTGPEDDGAGDGQEQPHNLSGDRIGRPEQIRIFRNYIHHNQHPSHDGDAAGYGVAVNSGAWAQVYENLFDANRHAIEAAGNSGGYEAFRNLVLKGGGYHDTPGPFGTWTHQFDVHGTGGGISEGWGGQASVQTTYAHNAFQYLTDNAIALRGRPLLRIDIHDNVFAHEGLEEDWGADAIRLDDRADLDVIVLGPNNTINVDSYGQYGVCDFDGDGVDDLFLPTGQTWWFSSAGEFPWTYLSARTERLPQVRLGYFDADERCDVLTASGDEWVIASAGTDPWTSIGRFGAPLEEVAFGQFDPNVRDHRPGATRRTTHAFRSLPDEQWLVTPLSGPNWELVGSSSFPMHQLRFGDFTGDGVTDVLAVQEGRWSISESARGEWRELNSRLSDDVSSLFIADLDHNNIDDLIRLGYKRFQTGPYIVDTFTWWVSDDGRSDWRALKSYRSTRVYFAPAPRVFGFAGRFGAAPGGGVLLIDPTRTGYFFSPAEIAVGARPEWTSVFLFSY
jgi:FG-GAP-like repeat